MQQRLLDGRPLGILRYKGMNPHTHTHTHRKQSILEAARVALVHSIVPSDRQKNNFDLRVSGQENIPAKKRDKRGVLVVANHGGEQDIASMVEALGREQTYVVLGEVVKKSGLKNRVSAEMVGPIWMDRFKKNSKDRMKKNVVRRLKQGYRVLIYPTASYEITPSNPVSPAKSGFYNFAKETDALILPAATEMDFNRGDVKFGEAITADQLVADYRDKNDYGDDFSVRLSSGMADFEVAEHAIADRIATLRWGIWEDKQTEEGQDGQIWSRRTAKKHYESLMTSKHWTGNPSFNRGDLDKKAVKRNKYKSTDSNGERFAIPDPDEAFGHLQTIPYNEKTAFLFGEDTQTYVPNQYSITNIYEYFAKKVADKRKRERMSKTK